MLGGSSALGIRAKLIIPFVIILLAATLALGLGCWWKMKESLLAFQEAKGTLLTRTLATQIADPFSMGEYDQIQKIIDNALHNDADVSYATVVLQDGRVVATTSDGVRSIRLDRNSFEREAAHATTMIRRELPDSDSGTFEMWCPLIVSDRPAAVLRIGFLTDHVRDTIIEAEWWIGIIGLSALLIGVSIYTLMIRRSILIPISIVGRLANRISRGDLSETVSVVRRDEIGQLLGNMNEMVSDLRSMAKVADSIASGDLGVNVDQRSSGDVFGTAFKKMVESLNAHTKELEAREERFRSLCQTSPVGIIETDSSGQISYANSRWEEMTGLQLSELAARPWYRTVHPDDQQIVIKLWDAMTRKDGKDYCAEFRIVRASGEVCWGRCLATPFRLQQDQTGYVGTIEDITKRKVSDMAQYGITAILSETRSVDEAAPRILELACHTLDLEAAILWKVSDEEGALTLAHIWSADPHDSGKDFVGGFTGSRSDGLAGLVWTVGRSMWMDREHLQQNIGSMRSIVVSKRQIQSAFACPIQVHQKTVGVMEFYSRASNKLNMDLLESYSSVGMQVGQFSERLEAENSARQLAAIVECSDDAIISATVEGTIVSWNKGAQRLFGYADDEVTGKSIDILMPNKQKEQFFEQVCDLISRGAVEGFETVNMRRDGTLVDVSLTISPIRSETDKIVAMSLIARDITHKKVVEQRMREFYAIVSHELRTPLTSIRGALGLLSEGIVPMDSAEGSELISLAKVSVVRLVSLINDILDLRKIEGGGLELDLETLDSSKIVSDGMDAMRETCAGAGCNSNLAD